MAQGDAEARAIAALDAMPWINGPKGGAERLRGADKPLAMRPGDPTAEEIVRELRD